MMATGIAGNRGHGVAITKTARKRDGSRPKTQANETGNSHQDMKFSQGEIVASDLLPGRKSAIDRLDLKDFSLGGRLAPGQTDRSDPFTREGMALFKEEIWLLPEDSPSRLFRFPIKIIKSNPIFNSDVIKGC